MILPGRPTGRAYLRPLSGRRADAGARPARLLMPDRSPFAPARSAPRSVGTLGSAACRSTTWSPSTTPSRRPVGDSKLTIFILVLFRVERGRARRPLPHGWMRFRAFSGEAPQAARPPGVLPSASPRDALRAMWDGRAGRLGRV